MEVLFQCNLHTKSELQHEKIEITPGPCEIRYLQYLLGEIRKHHQYKNTFTYNYSRWKNVKVKNFKT